MHNPGPRDLKKIIITYCCVLLIMVPFGLTERENICTFTSFRTVHDHTENFSVIALRRGSQYMANSLWVPRSPDWNLCDYYLWLTLKDDCSVSISQSLQELK